ncbi:MAG: hypothetical protein M1826_004387 [Phylliscum demangeonii]|nr:MAG: hypothetical protein M1826_004387 [Phylliscum demangeonii]
MRLSAILMSLHCAWTAGASPLAAQKDPHGAKQTQRGTVSALLALGGGGLSLAGLQRFANVVDHEVDLFYFEQLSAFQHDRLLMACATRHNYQESLYVSNPRMFMINIFLICREEQRGRDLREDRRRRQASQQNTRPDGAQHHDMILQAEHKHRPALSGGNQIFAFLHRLLHLPKINLGRLGLSEAGLSRSLAKATRTVEMVEAHVRP